MEIWRRSAGSPEQKVLQAIREGARTQAEIAKISKIGGDELCDVLAVLILDRREVVTSCDGETRRYFTRAA
jgi:hypothetical protein